MNALFMAAIVSFASQPGRADTRTWTDRSERFTIEAELVDYRDGVVRLKNADGKVLSVALEQLSDADRQFVEGQAAGTTGAHAASAGEAVARTGEAVVELLSGAVTRGRIVARDSEYVTVEVSIGNRSLSRKYPLDRIGVITIGGKREVLHGGGATSGTSPTGTGAVGGARRSRAEIEALIDRIGRTPPDWWDSVPLNYPNTLDLNWPMPAPNPWNARKNIGQYVWDIINPNPGKWKEGVRFMHFMLTKPQSNPQVLGRAVNQLAHMYHDLLQDYARAAFWWRQAGMGPGAQAPGAVKLAECYWKLGSKQMALELMGKIPTYYSSIKLLADMGETPRALAIVDAAARARNGIPDLAYLYAGDACRIDGQYGKAIQYYQKVLDVRPTGKQKNRVERNHQRARANIEGIRIFDTLDLSQVADGTYRAESPAYAGQLHVEVTVRGGRIESVRVTQHQEKQFYSALTDTPRQIIEKQGVKGVDAVTSATITSEAIINATAKALAQGLK
ncbi:MAG: SHD1 domain-containing protein [Planctomycetota bacterium]